MKEKRNLHLKVQELCDCYATNDPLKEMSVLKNETDTEEGALKWLALAALHGINNNANQISITKAKDGRIKVLAEYRVTELPSPGTVIGESIIDAIREITHIEGDKGKTLLALGIRENSIDIKVKVKSKDDGQRVTLEFPE